MWKNASNVGHLIKIKQIVLSICCHLNIQKGYVSDSRKNQLEASKVQVYLFDKLRKINIETHRSTAQLEKASCIGALLDIDIYY